MTSFARRGTVGRYRGITSVHGREPSLPAVLFITILGHQWFLADSSAALFEIFLTLKKTVVLIWKQNQSCQDLLSHLRELRSCALGSVKVIGTVTSFHDEPCSRALLSTLWLSPHLQQKKSSFSSQRPLCHQGKCFFCFSTGKRTCGWVTRNQESPSSSLSHHLTMCLTSSLELKLKMPSGDILLSNVG